MAKKKPQFVRFIVPPTHEAELKARETLPHWVRLTPRYFFERQRAEAEAHARATGSFVIDQFKEYDRRSA